MTPRRMDVWFLVILTVLLSGCILAEPVERNAGTDALAIKVITRSAVYTAFRMGSIKEGNLPAIETAAKAMDDLLNMPLTEAARENVLAWLKTEGCPLEPFLQDALDLLTIYYDVRPAGDLMTPDNKLRLQGLVQGLKDGVARCRGGG